MIILCDLAWKSGTVREEEENMLQPQINMMIKKQLDSRSDLLRKKGAIGEIGCKLPSLPCTHK
jgi:hypothetical protein